MNLKEWCSNSNEFRQSIVADDRTKHYDNKVLGMQWDSQDDILRLKFQFTTTSNKREILKAVASIYDPLGLCQPVTLRAKLFLQRLWDLKVGWDETLGDVLMKEWNHIREDLLLLPKLRIRRNPAPVISGITDLSIATFCDASASAYSAVVYLRVRNNVPHWTSFLIYAKSRLSPKKRSEEISDCLSIPRLELLGVLIGVRASRFVLKAISQLGETVPVYVFTDSMCVIHWLKSTKPLSVFVENRTKEITRSNFEVMYVNTAENPADFSTRGQTSEELRISLLWWQGPPWLSRDYTEWPVATVDSSSEVNAAVSEEERKCVPVFHTLYAGENHAMQHTIAFTYPLGIDASSYSSLQRLLRVTSLCLKFMKTAVWKRAPESRQFTHETVQRTFCSVSDGRDISKNDLDAARKTWIISLQNERYQREKNALINGRSDGLIAQLGLQLHDDGIIRCSGRLQHAALDIDAILPKLLGTNDPVTMLFVKHVHERLFHAGVSHTLSQLRREYWIPKGRTVVRKVISACILCRKYKGAAFALPKMPPWPRERLSRSSPFEFSGVDYFGPINVRMESEVRKMWVALFTCLAIRAVHLEFVADCSAKEFLQCIIRFVARRGTPVQMISDNAPQFRVSKSLFDKVWHEIYVDPSVISYSAERGITWKFTTELAPWQGGFYERLVGVVKSSLRMAIGRRLLFWTDFITVLTEVESVVNSRPLTYVYGDFPSGRCLRPTDFLTDLQVGMPVTDSSLRPSGLGDVGKNVLRLWKLKQSRLDTLWKFWHDEYLLSLRERYQDEHRSQRGAVRGSPTIGEVVLIKDTDAPRGSWRLGRVSQIVPGNDGAIRAAELKLSNGLSIRRAISHLYPLEVKVAEDVANVDNDFDGFTEDEVVDAVKRRKARQNLEQSLTVIATKLYFSKQ